MRSKRLSYPGVFATRSYGRERGTRTGYGDRDAQKKWDRELDSFVEARRQGVMPAGTQQRQIDAAMQISEREGVAWDASKNDFSDNRLRKVAAEVERAVGG
jgi:hypothetical protein